MLRFHGLYVFQVTTVSNLNLSCIELELGLGFDNIKVIGPEEMPILVWGGGASAPQLKWDRPKTYKF